MNIAVYSGSFNPLHIGHLAIMRYLTEEAGFDCVYLIVSPKNPLKDGISSATGRDRYEAAKAAVARHESLKVKTDDIELSMPEPHYTIRTLDALKEREPENEFSLVMGADNLAVIRKWREYKRLLSDFGCLVYPRNGYDLEDIRRDLLAENPAYRIVVLDAEMVDISSSDIRAGIARGEDMSAWLM